MRWEIINNRPKPGDVRYKTKFAFLPTTVLSKITMTDHRIWLELYLEEQEYVSQYDGMYATTYWKTVAKTIHV